MNPVFFFLIYLSTALYDLNAWNRLYSAYIIHPSAWNTINFD